MSSNGQGSELKRARVLSLAVHLGSFSDFVRQVITWAEAGQSRYVCAAPVALCMESYYSEDYRRITDEADLVSPDGKPIVWALRKLGHRQQGQVCGPELMPAVCAEAEERGLRVGLYGGSDEELSGLMANLQKRFSKLQISYSYSPPFRPLSEEEDAAICREISASGAEILFVGLGCPKQERWMAAHKGRIPAVMLGVGAAFLFHSGVVERAPESWRKLGLEWLFRLLKEPRRLFKRYLLTNSAYLWHTGFLNPWVLARQQRRFARLYEQRTREDQCSK